MVGLVGEQRVVVVVVIVVGNRVEVVVELMVWQV